MALLDTRLPDPDWPLVLPPGLSAAEGALDLLPLPAAIVGRRGDNFIFEGVNRAYRLAGLGTIAERSRLLIEHGEEIAAFLTSTDQRIEFAWQAGDAVEARHYRVTVARMANAIAPRALVTLLDQTGELRTERSLRREMSTDSLTGLPNRTGFGELLDALLARGDARFAVLVVDLDRFNRVNACLGSLTGDELLMTVARRLKGALRASDILARTGGDEFGILLTIDKDSAEAEDVAARIRSVFAAPFRLSEYEVRVGCSIGVAFGSETAADAEAVIRHAQFAVKRSKQSGAAEAYQPQAFDFARAQFAMETALRRAIDGGQLSLAYQPICELATGKVVAFEALARWSTDDGMVLPNAFIPVAEESGLIVPLGRWAIDAAVRTLAEWDARNGGDCGVRVAVNLSAIQLHRDAVATVVADALRTHGIAGERLKLELTESALVSDPDRVAATLHELKALGTTLAMDDFGTGYSNLAYLQKLPIDLLKIDRSFVTDMLADPDKIAIVRAVLSLAQALGMQTVAEGIESLDLGRTLAALGCTFGQGYAYARPLDPDAAYALFRERNS